MNRLQALAWMALLSALTCTTAAETWTNVYGRKFKAEFLRLQGDEAIFKLPNGRMFSTAVEDLSPADQLKVAGNITRTAPLARAIAATPSARDSPAILGGPWPREVRVDGASRSKIISEDRDTDRFVYESPKYRFTCNARITDDALRNFAMMFECTHKFARALPLGMGNGTTRAGRLDILLFATAIDYHRAGGPQGSSGCYVPGKEIVMVPMPSLGLVRGSTGFHLDRARKNHVLVHELAHQVTPHAYMQPGAVGWFSEGLAEYIAVTPYTWGRFAPDPHGRVVKDFVTARGKDGTGGRALGTTITAPRLRNFMLMTYPEFSGKKANFNYGFSLLLTHYFFHMQDNGRARRITAFVRGLRSGLTGERALEPLLDGSSYEVLERDISQRWAKLGVNIRF